MTEQQTMEYAVVDDEARNYVEYGENYLRFSENTPFEVWQETTLNLMRMEKSIRWWIGDAIRFGEYRYGEKYAQFMQTTGYAYQTLANSVWVASHYPEISQRQENLPFGHYEAAAALEPKERAGLLKIAASASWTQRQLREEVRDLRERDASANVRTQQLHRIVCPRCNGEGEITVET